MKRTWLPSALLLASLVVHGCSSGNDDTDTLVGVILGAVLGLFLLVSCGFTYATAVLVGGFANLQHNRKRPTVRSKRWGFVWGPLNLVNAAVGVWLIYALATSTSEEPPGASTWLFVVAGTLATLAVGAVCVVKAAQAQPPSAKPEPSADASLGAS